MQLSFSIGKLKWSTIVDHRLKYVTKDHAPNVGLQTIFSNSVTSTNKSCNSHEENNAKGISPHSTLYKIGKTPMSQKDRREKLLQEMKLRRNTVVDGKRGLFELISDEDDMEIMETEESVGAVTKRRRRRKKSQINWHNRLMLSEWFTEIPDDLESNWLVKLCPVGVRNLVVAQNHATTVYSMKGKLGGSFQSDLPGGNDEAKNHGRFAVLDCIYSRSLECYFVLDIIAWNNQYFADSDTDFRFYLLKSKLEESPQLKETNALNHYPFVEITYFPAELSRIQDELSHPYRINNQEVPLDGVLFYHRATRYIKRFNPLFGWLKPFMIPEKLQVPIYEGFMQFIPKNYVALQQYLDNTPPKQKKKGRKQKIVNVENAEEMEAESHTLEIVL